ncbi:AtpZ/AtpI family protein [Alkalithermobacter paradoxus]|uniref:Putative F0F1-ATPase subunit n=1 Tax=Alkalithermobacter paradoxus TaxID=29349 RepID=A0A1V4I6U9_9FIRM|nr:putative F0F1-ATPase subunit [[Clostridium] thermoalcaliphilum]
MDKKNKWLDALENLSLISQIGISMVSPIIVCVLIGNFLDKKMNTQPLFLFIFIVLGVASSFVNLYKIALRDKKKRK